MASIITLTGDVAIQGTSPASATQTAGTTHTSDFYLTVTQTSTGAKAVPYVGLEIAGVTPGGVTSNFSDVGVFAITTADGSPQVVSVTGLLVPHSFVVRLRNVTEAVLPSASAALSLDVAHY